jgi:hypothetical protein
MSKIDYHMASICFGEWRNVIGCGQGMIFPYCPWAIRNIAL